ncbi:1534_t:CDS:2 [Dentiscutata heterogama]|uniref:1534_t:CDS:1 n=1 Tax=Dentiscutata heterogama TaxID=1316150 RepID=A0ACA9N3G5_9GLOM|nr:1534_t:CDS:2 [Dentiscutata heterogama]
MSSEVIESAEVIENIEAIENAKVIKNIEATENAEDMQDSEELYEKKDDYILVTSYAKYRSLNKNLADIFKFGWKIKLQILHDIISNLNHIHYKRYLHQDLHLENILLKEDYETYIINLGLSKPLDEKDQDHINGVLPYIAPELFQRKPYT